MLVDEVANEQFSECRSINLAGPFPCKVGSQFEYGNASDLITVIVASIADFLSLSTELKFEPNGVCDGLLVWHWGFRVVYDARDLCLNMILVDDERKRCAIIRLDYHGQAEQYHDCMANRGVDDAL